MVFIDLTKISIPNMVYDFKFIHNRSMDGSLVTHGCSTVLYPLNNVARNTHNETWSPGPWSSQRL